MTELMNNKGIKPIAFYLPQFHSIPENDEAYGKGFTEWTNVKKAKALFEGHNQPRVPLNENYYSLVDEDIMVKQASLAKKYGIYGFCYYHYWFKNGKKLLEKPVEAMLKNKAVDMPFCLCWANENWSKRWDGGNNELIVEQDYGEKTEWKKHLEYLIGFFSDERYITIKGAPLFIIYKPELMPNCEAWVKFLHEEIKKYGFSDIVVAVQYPKYYLNGYPRDVFDYYIDFEPAYTRIEEEIANRSNKIQSIYKLVRKTPLKRVGIKIYSLFHKNQNNNLEIRDYAQDWTTILRRDYSDPKIIPGAFVDWDNTPRNKAGLAYKGANPEEFGNYLSKLVEVVNKRDEKCFFINAWNEWAEGAYLEPDEKNGYGYLEAIKRIV